MKLTLKKLEKMSDLDKILYWKFIRHFASNSSPTELKKIIIILSRVPRKKKELTFKGEGKECRQCLDFKKWAEFPFSFKYKNRKSSICRTCINLNTKYNKLLNINTRIAGNLRNRMVFVLKNNIKCEHTEQMCGCTIDEVRVYLESKFRYNMSWENYGSGKNGKGMKEWHIDHIKPCASFNLSEPEEQRKCFHFSNLQPLWAKENLEKSDNY